MHTAPAGFRSKRAIDLYFLYVAFVTVVYGLVVFPRFGRKWLLSDWLIGYQGGFVRRGLPGEVFYLLGRGIHLQPALLAVAANLVVCGRWFCRRLRWRFRSSAFWAGSIRKFCFSRRLRCLRRCLSGAACLPERRSDISAV